MSAAGRAIVGAIALYGLLLQVFLAAAAPVGAPDLRAAICAAGGDAAPHGPDKPVRHDAECCTAAHAAKLAPPPADVAFAPWAPAASIAVSMRPRTFVLATGPPVHAHSARGPPLPV